MAGCPALKAFGEVSRGRRFRLKRRATLTRAAAAARPEAAAPDRSRPVPGRLEESTSRTSRVRRRHSSPTTRPHHLRNGRREYRQKGWHQPHAHCRRATRASAEGPGTRRLSLSSPETVWAPWAVLKPRRTPTAPVNSRAMGQAKEDPPIVSFPGEESPCARSSHRLHRAGHDGMIARFSAGERQR